MSRPVPSRPSHHPTSHPLVLDLIIIVLISLSVAFLLFVALSPPTA